MNLRMGKLSLFIALCAILANVAHANLAGPVSCGNSFGPVQSVSSGE
ncbi:MAG: hypothetical protein HY606_07140 [Planctomycetes bacterium]|nr:hypothetical protein [Planctomycetota bacterium]